MKRPLSLALLAAAALPALAQTPPAPPSGRPIQMPRAGMPVMRKYPGVSDAGNAILAESQSAPDPQLMALLRQQRSLRDEFAALAMAPTIDLDKVQMLLKQQEDVQAQVRQRSDERLLGVVRQLPVADRGPFMRALASPPQPPR